MAKPKPDPMATKSPAPPKGPAPTKGPPAPTKGQGPAAERSPELAAVGRSMRKDFPRSKLGEWVAPADRRDPVAVLEEQAVGRVQELVPLRYARMSRLAVHLLPRGGGADGQRPRHPGQHRAPGAAGRRRAPGQLRRVRDRRALPDLRPERLRRDPPRALRMGREASGGQLRGRRAAQGTHAGAVRADRRSGCG